MKIAEKVKEFFHNEGIHSTTIQPEFVEMNEVGVLSRDSDFPSGLFYALSVA
jgi:zinc transporter 1